MPLRATASARLCTAVAAIGEAEGTATAILAIDRASGSHLSASIRPDRPVGDPMEHYHGLHAL